MILGVVNGNNFLKKICSFERQSVGGGGAFSEGGNLQSDSLLGMEPDAGIYPGTLIS